MTVKFFAYLWNLYVNIKASISRHISIEIHYYCKDNKLKDISQLS